MLPFRLRSILCALVVWPLAAQEPATPVAEPLRRDAPRVGSPEEGEQRLALARDLMRADRHAEALSELLWCFDRGHLKNRAFWSTRLGPVLDSLGQLGAEYAPARDELVRRRDLRDAALLAQPPAPVANNDVAELLALNDVLAESTRSVVTYDKLAERRAAADLAFFYAGIRIELWRAKRYRTLVDGRLDAAVRLSTAAVALREASRRLVGQELHPDPAFTARVVADVCLDVEARMALDDTKVGNELADAVVAFAPTWPTYARLIVHAERAGSEALATRLERAALCDRDADAKEDFAREVVEARAELHRRLKLSAR